MFVFWGSFLVVAIVALLNMFISPGRDRCWCFVFFVLFIVGILVCLAGMFSSPFKNRQRIGQPSTPTTRPRLTQEQLAEWNRQCSPPSKHSPGAASNKSVNSSVIAKFCGLCCGGSGDARVAGVNHGNQSDASGTLGGDSDVTMLAENPRGLLEQDRQTVREVERLYNEIFQNRHWLRKFDHAGMPSKDKCLRTVLKRSRNVPDVSMTYSQLQQRVADRESLLQRGTVGIAPVTLSFGEENPATATRRTVQKVQAMWTAAEAQRTVKTRLPSRRTSSAIGNNNDGIRI